MIKSTVGQLLVNDALPQPLRDYNRVYDQKGLDQVLSDLAHQHPDKYRDVSKKLADLGSEIAFREGGLTFDLAHLARPDAATALAKQIEQKALSIYSNEQLTPAARKKAVVEMLKEHQPKMTDASYGEALKQNNPLAIMASLGFRGNKGSITGMLGSDVMYSDYKGDPIPFPITKSFSQGLSPLQFLASTYGARQGVVSTKMCLHEDELVLMADWSKKKIKDIEVSDMVMGADRQGKLFPTRVTKVFDNGVRLCYRYVFRIGRLANRLVSVACTEEHKILAVVRKATGCVAEKEVRTPTPLPVGSAILRDNPVRNSFSAWLARGSDQFEGDKVREALIAGLMTGDGCMAPSSHGSYQFSCADDLLIQDTTSYMASVGLAFKQAVGYAHNLNDTKKHAFQRKQNGQIAVGHANPTKRWLRSHLGDKLAHEKTLPMGIENWDRESIAAFIGGVFSTDGSFYVAKKRKSVVARLYMTAKPLVLGIRGLLETRFGIWCSDIVEVPPTRRAYAKNSLFGFSLVGYEAIMKFAKVIPLVGKKRIFLARNLKGLRAGPHHEHVTCKIQGRSELGPCRTFDIEVDNADHLFALANGLIVSNSTAEAGALNKQLTQAAHQVMVSRDDDDGDWHTSETRGLPVKVDDQANVGALLAKTTGEFPKNTVLTPKVLKLLQQQGHDQLLVRSPLVGGTADGGVHARDAGIRNSSKLPSAGSFLGIEGGQGAGEPLAQLQLSNKHSGGVAGAAKIGGFKLIESLANPPKNMPGGAVHAQEDGIVDRIEENPAGGRDVWINGKKHYVPHYLAMSVGKGDRIEAGDLLSEGLPNPRNVVEHKGLGEGRRYLMNTLHSAYKENRISNPGLRRNLEAMVRGMVSHVKMNDFWGGHTPDDVVNYNHIESNWSPRPGFVTKNPRAAVGKYLEVPVLHHTIGTKIRPSMLPEFERFGIDNVAVHDAPPPFKPHLLRATENLQHDENWQVRLGGQYLQRGLLDAAHRGLSSSTTGNSFIPAMIQGQDIAKSLNKQPATK